MKIKQIQISGFRGIPPVTPPNVDIQLADSNGEIKDLLLYGPNAYGKSSIADALEWFFKENVRCSAFFEDYCAEDNVHLNLGKPQYPQNAFVELVLIDNGKEFTARKELDCSGKKSSENLGGIQHLMLHAQDEIIVLDHDQFRNFVAAANKDKWSTFSSLIGFEELDYFRSGLDSITGNSLSSHFQLERLQTEVESKERQWQCDLEKAAQDFSCTTANIEDLKSHFRTLLEANLSSLEQAAPDVTTITELYWHDLLSTVKTSADVIYAANRLSNLTVLKNQLNPFDEDYDIALTDFNNEVRNLAKRKLDFDKELLSIFYQKGLQVLDEKKSTLGKCPFCSKDFDWDDLREHVHDLNKDLNFAGIQSGHQEIMAKWRSIQDKLQNRQSDFQGSSLTEIQQVYQEVSDFDRVSNSLALSNFDEEHIQHWVDKVRDLFQKMATGRAVAENEISEIEAQAENPQAEIQQTIIELQRFWETIVRLDQDLQENVQHRKELNITDQVIQGLRKIASEFRIELSDFSGRVASTINLDVQNYYKELHPLDDIVPSLDVSIAGNQRKVTLTCVYRGIPDRKAVTLLSESHRNSLGMAVLLAFMKYKRQLGSPIEFIIFDDVTQSFDVEHRTNLLTLLENKKYPEIYDQQIIFLTHDRSLADLVKRPGEKDYRENWKRYDIRNWWLKCMLIEPEGMQDPLARADYYLQQGDEIAAAVYTRRGLEQKYKMVIERTGMRIPYTEKPWKLGPNDFRQYIFQELNELWTKGIGFMDPTDPNLSNLFTSQRILNFCVHDSSFLDNPMTVGDVQNALTEVRNLESRFKCQCGTWYHTLQKDSRGNPPRCKAKGGCQLTLV